MLVDVRGVNFPDLALAVDTATPVGGLALFRKSSGLLAELRTRGGRRHSASLLANLDFLLCSAGVSLADIDFITITRGPGSFTGLRVGISTVKGLCFGLDRPVVAVSSLEAMALSFPAFENLICPVFDARKREIYGAAYIHDGEGLKEVIPEQAIGMEGFIKKIIELPISSRIKILFAGSGTVPYRDLILSMVGERAVFPPEHLDHPLPSAVAVLGFDKALKGEFVNPSDLQPIYLRKSEAEISEERRAGIGTGVNG